MLLVSALFLALAFVLYGRFLEKRFDVRNDRPTPSHSDYDGVDRVPANRFVLLGHHFSSIAGAGPIVGPIIAAVAFGWLPTLLWVLLGAVFIGGVHDYSSLIGSIRHKARSIAEVAKEYMTPLAYKLMLAFIWLTLVYVLTVFTDLTSTTFVEDGGVATSSLLFIALAVGFGLFIYRLKIPILWSSLLFVPLVYLCTWVGHLIPLSAENMPVLIGDDPSKTWDLILIAYVFIASTLPVWLLLQPRDYLSSFLLYGSVLGGFIGMLLGGFTLAYPAFTGWDDPALGSLFPILFITVACGACSGFHGVVASGTTSKQVEKETDARVIGLGAMLLEALVAVLALATVMILAPGDAMLRNDPNFVYAHGLARYLGMVGVGMSIALPFALLAFSTFVYDTLDVCTRLARYILQEMFGLKQDRKGAIIATITTLLLPLVFLLNTMEKGYLVAWPIFGTTNQLMASLTLLAVVIWLRKSGRRTLFAILPTLFMFGMTMWALFLQVKVFVVSLPGLSAGAKITPDTIISGVCGIVLLVPAFWLLVEATRIFISGGRQSRGSSEG